MRRSDHILGFQDAIWKWFSVHKRTLPWRDLAIKNDTQRAYLVLISEIMLQQTQVDRVKIVFNRFIDHFPTLQDLARASNRDVILIWQGMGYNSRALRLRDAAKTIVALPGSTFPKELDQLLSIKGIGPYTASAIRNFAFHLPTPCIDTNIRRILHRSFIGPENPDGTWSLGDRALLPLAEEVLSVALEHAPKGMTTADWHAALMDFGSLVQTKNTPKWKICPLTERGLMKTTPTAFEKMKAEIDSSARKGSKEPGREVAGKFIPNRIFRGRIVEVLRTEPTGLTPEQLGREICIDWERNLEPWLQKLIKKLVQDKLIAVRKSRVVLAD